MSTPLTSSSTHLLLSFPSSLHSTSSNRPMVWRGTIKKTCIRNLMSAATPMDHGATNQKPGTRMPKQFEESEDPVGGRLLQDGVTYSQNISIRSFEIGNNGKISIGALVHHLQDTSLNHVKHIGLLDQGFGSTSEMSRNDLIWVVRNLQIEAERYPYWSDTIQVDTWLYASGKNGIGRNWLVIDVRTGEILIQANCVYVMMNKKTRRMSKLLKEIKDEYGLSLTNDDPIIRMDTKYKSQLDTDTTDYLSAGLKPGWTDMDLNQHVNHVKYIDWIFESIPHSFMACHELYAINLSYLKECHMNDVLLSMSKMVKNSSSDFGDDDDDVVEFEHLLRLEDGSRILQAGTLWKPKGHKNK